MTETNYVFTCDNEKDNPDFPCDIHLYENVQQQTEITPIKTEDSFELEYGFSHYLDSEKNCYYCNNCDTQFTYEEVLELIGEEEE
jgi:hypothetical protein|tara:strand:+ start:846 stop:1100 length:255 start_codon:yes stop_codon:yes gene_type:complete